MADYPIQPVEIRKADLPVCTKRNRDFFHSARILLDESPKIKQRLEQASKYEEENDVDSLAGIAVSVMFVGGKLNS